MTTRSLLLLCVMVGATNRSLSGVEAPDSLVLVQDGRPRATIVLAETPTSSAQLAAYELQHYVKKISGAKLPMVREPAEVTGNRILVGESAASRAIGYGNGNFAHQEYAIKTFGGALLLIGHDSRHFGQVDYDSGDTPLTRASLTTSCIRRCEGAAWAGWAPATRCTTSWKTTLA